jgi:hypothetical protein
LLRRLFEATNFTMRLCDGGHHVAISIRLPADTIAQIVGTVEAISQTINESSAVAPDQAMPVRLCRCCTCPSQRAPGRIRTCDTRFRKPMLYPLSYEG